MLNRNASISLHDDINEMTAIDKIEEEYVKVKSVRHFKLLCKTTIYRTQIPLIAQIFFKQQHDLWNLRDLCDQFQVSAYGLRLSLQNQMSNNICGGPSPMPPNRGSKGG